MHAARKLKQTASEQTLGLAAIGSEGDWEVAIDETTSGTRRWFAQIESRVVYLYFAIPSPRIIGSMLDFLTPASGEGQGVGKTAASEAAEILIGNSKDEPVTLVRDDEFPDRFFLVGESRKKLVCRVTIGGDDLKCFVGALQQAKEELDEAEAD